MYCDTGEILLPEDSDGSENVHAKGNIVKMVMADECGGFAARIVLLMARSPVSGGSEWNGNVARGVPIFGFEDRRRN